MAIKHLVTCFFIVVQFKDSYKMSRLAIQITDLLLNIIACLTLQAIESVMEQLDLRVYSNHIHDEF